ncbi:unnamed protein product [Microthlaspi erraticum]|uniref:DOMON domain-containing protein n=1 Tax=Microthlaspi erraticum TaxID=1685480 RepID=A0A6D2KGI8_9BRAS|nr:unnamed protein product [Microthlaspi erraticum]
MKFYSVFFIFGFIALQFLPLSTQQGTESCNSALPLNDLTINSSLLQCVEAWSSQNFIIRYAKTVDNTWSFILSAPDLGAYIGIGFSTNGRMIGASAIVGWMPADGGGGQVKPYFLGGQSPPEVMPDQGDLKIVNGSLKIESVSSRLYMSFELTAELPRQSLLYAMGPAGIFPTSPDFRLREHRVMTATTINYITGSQSVVKGSPHDKLRKTHGLMNIANNVATHASLGIAILVMGILQVLAMLARPHLDSKYRKYWNWYHHNVGRVLIILAISNIFYGIHLAKAGSSWNGGYGFAVAVLALTAIGLEVKKFMNK